MLPLIVAIVAVIYTAQMIWLRVGLERSDIASGENAYEPMVSIIVAARDEEEFIGECLASLLRLEYPPQKLEIIVVNDGSSDRTAEIVGKIASVHTSVRLHTSVPGKNNLRGKTNAVAQGIEISRGEILMMTDADCVVPGGWVSSTVKQFREGVGIVGGFTILEGNSAFAGIQALDWLFLFSLSSAMTGWRMPLTVIGNNLSVRRSAYGSSRNPVAHWVSTCRIAIEPRGELLAAINHCRRMCQNRHEACHHQIEEEFVHARRRNVVRRFHEDIARTAER